MHNVACMIKTIGEMGSSTTRALLFVATLALALGGAVVGDANDGDAGRETHRLGASQHRASPGVTTPRGHLRRTEAAVPSEWERSAFGSASEGGQDLVRILIAVRMDGEKEMQEKLLDVSDPRSDEYGQYWNIERLAQVMGTRPRAQIIVNWLRSIIANSGRSQFHKNGRPDGSRDIVRATLAGDFVVAHLTINECREAFGLPDSAIARYSLRLSKQSDATSNNAKAHHRYALTPEAVVEGVEIRLPKEIEPLVDFVSGLDLPNLRSPRPRPAAAAHDAALRRHNQIAGSHAAAQASLADTSTVQEGSPLPSSSSSTVPSPPLPPPSPSPSQLADTGSMTVVMVEARDRAMQAHVALHVPVDHSTGLNNTKGVKQPLRFEAIVTPTRHQTEYLSPVKLGQPFTDASCQPTTVSSGVATTTCVVVLGPSLGLANYVPTTLRMRAVFDESIATPWAAFNDWVYPTKSMTVQNVRRLYGVPHDYRCASRNATQAVANFLGIYVSPVDSQRFNALMGVPPQPTFSVVGENDPKALTDVEGSIDVQWMQAMVQGGAMEYWSTPGGSFGHEPFLDWVVSVANSTSPALIHSLSYGENEDAYDFAYENRVNLEFLKLGLRGVSVLVSSGDTGVQGGAQQGGAPPQCAPFVPIWPASSPYVTAVGGTAFSDHVTDVCDMEDVYSYGTSSRMPFACPDDDIGEIVCSTDTGAMITSGGGFSNRFSQPSYQQDAVHKYLDLATARGLAPAASNYNASGRGYPDIAAIGQNVPVVFNGTLQMVGGTSSSAPIAGAIFTLVNGELLRAGLPPLGFLNPLLYTLRSVHSTALKDVRAGNNSGGNRLLPEYVTCDEGFPALPGWDASTGLGSLDFSQLMEHVFGSIHGCDLDSRRGGGPWAMPDCRSGPPTGDIWSTGSVSLPLLIAACVASAVLGGFVSSAVVLQAVRGRERNHGSRTSKRSLMEGLMSHR